MAKGRTADCGILKSFLSTDLLPRHGLIGRL